MAMSYFLATSTVFDEIWNMTLRCLILGLWGTDTHPTFQNILFSELCHWLF